MSSAIVKLLSGLTRLRRTRCKPDELLVLVPSCLQHSQCDLRLTNDINACRRCGRCKVKDVVEVAEQYGCRCAIATGGRLALQMAKDPIVKAVVAVACEKELREGLSALFPKAGIGVVNLRPNGPCKDTDVDMAEVEDAIRWFLGLKPKAPSAPE